MTEIVKTNDSSGITEKILKPEFLFPLLGSIFGLIFIFITPPFQVPDEYQHFQYAYAISTGKLFGSTAAIPSSIQSLINETTTLPGHAEKKISYTRIIQFVYLPLNPAETSPSYYPTTAKYTPVPYLPVAAAIFVARKLSFNPFDLFYFGRIINLFFWMCLGYFSLRIFPDQKWALLLILLSPMCLFEAGSYSADVFLNSISCLWISLCLNYSSAYRDEALSEKSKLLLISVALLLSFTKSPYIFLLGFFFIIPQKKFGNPHQYRNFLIRLFGIACLIFLLSMTYLINDKSVSLKDGSVNMIRQLRYLIGNPLKFPVILLYSIKKLFFHYWYSSIGVFGYLDTVLPNYIYITYPVILLFCLLFDKTNKLVHSLRQKTFLVLFCFLSFFTIELSLYLTWTPVGNQIIDGFQGRYLIPVFPALIPLFKNKRLPALVSGSGTGIPVMLYIFAMLCISVRTIILRYYFV